MKFVLQLLWLTLWAAAAPPPPLQQQKPLGQSEVTTKVPGPTNATFGPVPEAEQLFWLDSFDIAPLPLPEVSDEFPFVLTRGGLKPHPFEQQQNDPDGEYIDDLFAHARLAAYMSVVYPDGTSSGLWERTRTLRTTAFSDFAQLSIRNETGQWVEHLPRTGISDIMADIRLFVGPLVETGTYTLKVVAELKDGQCLFAITLTQWMEGPGWIDH